MAFEIVVKSSPETSGRIAVEVKRLPLCWTATKCRVPKVRRERVDCYGEEKLLDIYWRGLVPEAPIGGLRPPQHLILFILNDRPKSDLDPPPEPDSSY
ncbi:hypothetical protein ACN38_g68 [Penicillium nordicum]|uniref:Uncharacterized protein n=1 Tax=Penicillium nordicum TaxID=229535 RepID=A0A0M8PHV9_9EURO|nr:hypothetical protein ACN38_g68 [Penicillium nordicum]